jgi:putative endonuclease
MWRERAARCGERIAAEFVTLRGMEVLDRNVRIGRGEIDLVARDRDQVVFIEVKFRTAGSRGTSLEVVGMRKREHVARAAAGYLQRRGLLDRAVRFDVVGITWRADGEELLVQHVSNAYPGGRSQFF